jgi:hypothetical protein
VEAALKRLYGPGFDFSLQDASDAPVSPLTHCNKPLFRRAMPRKHPIPERHYCTDTETSEPETAVTFLSGWIIAPLVIFTGNRPGIFAWKVKVVTTP